MDPHVRVYNLRAKVEWVYPVPDIVLIMDYRQFYWMEQLQVYLRWSCHQLYSTDSYYLMELKLHICTLFSTDISSTGDYYKTIWIFINGTQVFYLFQPCYEHTYLLMIYQLIQQDSSFVRCRHHQSMSVYIPGNAEALINRQ